MKIKEMPIDGRPRERFIKHGASALSDAELMAIILRTGTKNENVIDMSNRLITFSFFVPVLRIIAISSASLNALAPCLMNLSRGLPSMGISFIFINLHPTSSSLYQQTLQSHFHQKKHLDI